MKKLIILFGLCLFICQSNVNAGLAIGVGYVLSAQTGIMRGNDGKEYSTIRIGNQVWMMENLRETQYRNGNAIPEVRDNNRWASLTRDARCSYDNNEGNADTYGYLYNWYAVNNKQNIAPEGWRVPTDDDWKELERHLGMNRSVADETSFRGSPVGSKLAGNASLWRDGRLKNNSEFGSSGFSMLPAGFRDGSYGHSRDGGWGNISGAGSFSNLGLSAYFWSDSENVTNAWRRNLHYFSSDVFRYTINKRYGLSIRLIQD